MLITMPYNKEHSPCIATIGRPIAPTVAPIDPIGDPTEDPVVVGYDLSSMVCMGSGNPNNNTIESSIDSNARHKLD